MVWLSTIRRSNGVQAAVGFAVTVAALVVAVFPAARLIRAQGAAAPTSLYLHGSGTTANPPVLFLDASAPVGATARYKDSTALNFSFGNAWKEVGTWGMTPAGLAQGDLTALGDLRIWLGLKNSDDQGTWFDVRAELFANGTVIASGLSRCVQGVTRNANLAKEVTVAFATIVPATFNGSSDSLVLKVSTRIGTNPDDSKCGGHNNAVGLRAYFDAVSRPSGFSATFQPNLGDPFIDAVTPGIGVVGTDVTILGQGFDPDAAGNTVTFGGVAAVVRSATATQIETTVPPGAPAGSSALSVTTRGGSASVAFDIANPAPAIGQISPESINAGSGATSLSVFGTGFIAASTVNIGGSVFVPSLQTDTSLQIVVPASLVAARGTHEVTVINPTPGGGASNALTLAVLGVEISGVEPASGPIGSAVTISGIGFDPSADGNQVDFNGVAALVLSATDTTIETTVPVGATTGPISVTTPFGTAVSDPYTVTTGSTLLISASPALTTYSQGQPITITTQLVDANGQNVPGVTAELASDPPADSQTGNTFVYESDGLYTITATVDEGGEPVTASLQLRVEGRAPSITCANPVDGASLLRTPGATITLVGSVTNAVGEPALTVNGQAVTVAADGTFSTPLVTAWGLNFVHLALVDGAGRSARRTCTFMLSGTFAPENQLLASSLSFKATQAAVDDGNRSGAVNSIGEILATALNSQGLKDTVHGGLLATNPLKASSCDQQICVFGACACVVSSQVTYISSNVSGPNETSVTLINGGLHSVTTVRNVAIRLRLNGRVSGIPYDTTGSVTYSSIMVGAMFDLGLNAGRPRVTIRPGSQTTQVGTVSTSFSGVDGWIINNIVVPLAQGTIRNTIQGIIQNFVSSNFNAILDGVVSGLDVTTLGPFAVPRLDGAGALSVGFGLGFSTVNTTTSRMLATLGTRFLTPAAHARPSLGVPLTGLVALDPSTSGQAMAVGVHSGVFNQALHALWRGGYFDVDLGEGDLSGLIPAGVVLRTTAGLPPIVTIRSDGRVEVAIGAVQAHVEHPALLAPTEVGVGGRASCDRRLDGNDLIVEDCQVDELHLSPGATLDASSATQLEEFLASALNQILSTAVNDALPALPIPGFRIPASLGQYGLPAGGVLGLLNPVLTTSAPHFVLRGNFGVR